MHGSVSSCLRKRLQPLSTLRDQIAQVLAEPAVKDKLRMQYMDPVGNSPEEFRRLLAADVARWKPVVERNKITLD